VLRSLFSGITGLRQHQTMMDVVANNISNVNTTGYKSSSAIFEDTLSQLMRPAGAPTGTTGGVNPSQVGLGVQLGGISTNFAQGSAQTTSRSTDLMIQGDGFFRVRNGTEIDYTRAGAFSFDSNGLLTNDEGMAVQGWTGVNGAINTSGTTGDIQIPKSTMLPPTVTTTVTIDGNIPADTPVDNPPTTNGTLTLGATVYDSLGMAHQLSMVFTNTGGGYTVDVTDATAGAGPTQGLITFDATGVGTVSQAPSITLVDGTNINLDISKITQYGGDRTLETASVDGAAAGTLQQLQIQADGTIVGVFSNEQKIRLAQVSLANFNNPMGLEKIGNTCFRSTSNSGMPQVSNPSSGGMGTLLSGALEMSNVDLAQEFTSMIVAQRGFQANSKVITTSDEMLQDLVNLKR